MFELQVTIEKALLFLQFVPTLDKFTRNSTKTWNKEMQKINLDLFMNLLSYGQFQVFC